MTKPITWTPTAETALKRTAGRLFATTREAAAILDCGPLAIRAGIKAGDIPAVRVGREWRVPTAWLRKMAALGTDMEAAGPA